MKHRPNQARKPNQSGFSLIELLIVVAIILIIAAIAIPNLLRARIAANEASAVQSIRTTNTAQVTYQSTYPNVGYASTMAILGPGAASCGTPTATNACLLDNLLASATASTKPKSGYYFTLTAAAAAGGTVNDYTVSGDPASLNQTGVRGFCSSSDGVIRFKSPGPTGVTTTAGCAALTPLQ